MQKKIAVEMFGRAFPPLVFLLLFGIVLSDEVDSQCHHRKTYTASCQCVKKLNLRQFQMAEGNQHGALQRKKRNQCIGKSNVSDGC